MWKLWHRFFGWHCISFKLGWDRVVRRVRWTPAGECYVKGVNEIIFLDELQNTHRDARPLTWTESERPALKVAA